VRRQGSGQALVEYVVLLALGSLVAIGVVTVAGPQLSDAYQQVSAMIANPGAAIAPTVSPSPTPMVPSESIASSESTPSAVATPAPTPAGTQTPALAPSSTPSAQTDTGPDSGNHTGGGQSANSQY
jgi:Flp pilus assembly pilin Flp